jgi:ubiquinone/menaquinone biosynthesis C-methylase UbiE
MKFPFYPYNYFQEIRKIVLAEFEKAKKIIGNGPDIKFLDIGCHQGNETIMIKDFFPEAEMHGVDIDEKHLKAAHEKGIKTHKVDAGRDKLPYGDSEFDLILSNQLIEHIQDPDLHLQEVYRVLKKDGLLIIGTPNLAALHNRFLLMLGMQPTCLHISRVQLGNPMRGRSTNDREHINGFTRKGFKELLKHHDFKLEDSKSTNVFLTEKLAFPLLHRIFPAWGHIQFWICRK